MRKHGWKSGGWLRAEGDGIRASSCGSELPLFPGGRANAAIQEGFAFISWFQLCHPKKKCRFVNFWHVADVCTSWLGTAVAQPTPKHTVSVISPLLRCLPSSCTSINSYPPSPALLWLHCRLPLHARFASIPLLIKEVLISFSLLTGPDLSG